MNKKKYFQSKKSISLSSDVYNNYFDGLLFIFTIDTNKMECANNRAEHSLFLIICHIKFYHHPYCSLNDGEFMSIDAVLFYNSRRPDSSSSINFH